MKYFRDGFQEMLMCILKCLHVFKLDDVQGFLAKNVIYLGIAAPNPANA